MWLGKDNKHTAAAWDCIGWWGRSYDSDIKQEDMVEQGRSSMSDLIDIASRPWFTGAWTYQEISLARKAVVLCGPYRMDWPLFASGGCYLGW